MAIILKSLRNGAVWLYRLVRCRARTTDEVLESGAVAVLACISPCMGLA